MQEAGFKFSRVGNAHPCHIGVEGVKEADIVELAMAQAMENLVRTVAAHLGTCRGLSKQL